MTELRTYYRPLNLTEIPVRVFWPRAKTRFGASAYVFTGFLLVRKLLRWRFQTQWAFALPEKPLLLTWDELPLEARLAMEPRAAQCRNYGMTLACCAEAGHYIGSMRRFQATFIDPTQTVSALVLWTGLRAGTGATTQIVLSFLSTLSDGRILRTTTEELPLLENTLPERYEEDFLAPDTTTGDALAEHKRRLEAQAAPPVARDIETIFAEFSERTREVFDHMIAHGHLVPISPKEAERLLRRGWE